MDRGVPMSFHGFTRRAKALANGSCFAVLLLTLLYAQFSATTHELTVRHAICPQHGELVDLDGRGAGAAAPVSLPGFTSAPFENHHQHCLFVSSRGKRDALRFEGAHSAPTPAISQSATIATVVMVESSRDLYRSAPKHSPPIA